MSFQSLSADTAPDIEARQIEAWRGMSPADKLAIVAGLTEAVFELAWAGVMQRHADASPRERAMRFAVVIHGRDLARRMYPEFDTLDL